MDTSLHKHLAIVIQVLKNFKNLWRLSKIESAQTYFSPLTSAKSNFIYSCFIYYAQRFVYTVKKVHKFTGSLYTDAGVSLLQEIYLFTHGQLDSAENNIV